MLECLKDNLCQDADNPALRVIVIQGKGPVFSAGHDLRELVSGRIREGLTLLMVKLF